MNYWTNQWFRTEKEARIGVMQAGYISKHVEVYQENNHWRFRLNEIGLADQAASTAEVQPRKKLPDPPVRKRLPIERKRLT